MIKRIQTTEEFKKLIGQNKNKKLFLLKLFPRIRSVKIISPSFFKTLFAALKNFYYKVTAG